ncbi:nuclear transport factor 2 family protein [Spongiimicrobium salis]|uniref:nuclear transport factor 2 family protein n=1 Tax=Spongiimicrobium salis TaxID=1667022 RepID=UPI00374D5271
MKKYLLTTAIILLTVFSTQAQEDRKAVEKTLNYYLEGGTNNDFDTLKKAFHNTATMKFIGGEYKEVNAIDFFKKVMKPGPKQNRKTKIASIDISGNAAHAKLEIEYATSKVIDYMNLLKVDGQWKIVGKIFYRMSK